MATAGIKKKIWLSSPHMGGDEIKFVQEAFDTNWIAPLGPNVDAFEADLAGFTGAAHVAALSSGTSAIHLALILLGVGKGDDVICQSLTFSASANPITYLGANPIFIDSEPGTWNMDPEVLSYCLHKLARQGRKPKAIIPVHLYGMPARMNEILAISRQYGVPVVEDAAEALGSTINDIPCGRFGDLGILSFNGNKIITTSGGGALLSDNKEWIEKARFLATQARDNAPHYQHSQIGYNYRMSNVVAGIGRGQMRVLRDRIAQRRKNFEFYTKALQEIDGITFLPEMQGAFSNRWLSTILIDSSKTGVSKEELRLALDMENIECRPLWKPMHLQPVFRRAAYVGENISERLFESGLCLPSGSNLLEEDLLRVVKHIKDKISARRGKHSVVKVNRHALRGKGKKSSVKPETPLHPGVIPPVD